MKSLEQFVLTISDRGFGKRSSSYDFRLAGRGGKGIRATDVSKADEIGKLVAAFPVTDADQIMLLSSSGQVIRTRVDEVRIASRATKGVRIFNTGRDERVVAVERIPDSEDSAEMIAVES